VPGSLSYRAFCFLASSIRARQPAEQNRAVETREIDRQTAKGGA